MTLFWVLMTAVLCAVITLLVVALWAHFYFQPRLRGSLQKELDAQVEQAATVLAERVEEAVRRGLVEGVRDLPSREVLQGASRNLARTSAELVGERLGQIFGRRERD
ncbi:hypothetical protein A11A3_04945 [Alcanivorax hongdengensis A-11-3]|uniref:Uncharacterized protein n=1 Tax=Alcanivorax hongdengensis A-11-3 TaxID=1177179 RepID=L0WEZ9_9GAMM|nr:hypothetical protein [Alcanivorax hongdengensis]EKF75299.1 hypothetical protein A11A3_04945 [Alcanivorax hongdengensis A-11-3]